MMNKKDILKIGDNFLTEIADIPELGNLLTEAKIDTLGTIINRDNFDKTVEKLVSAVNIDNTIVMINLFRSSYDDVISLYSDDDVIVRCLNDEDNVYKILHTVDHPNVVIEDYLDIATIRKNILIFTMVYVVSMYKILRPNDISE